MKTNNAKETIIENDTIIKLKTGWAVTSPHFGSKSAKCKAMFANRRTKKLEEREIVAIFPAWLNALQYKRIMDGMYDQRIYRVSFTITPEQKENNLKICM